MSHHAGWNFTRSLCAGLCLVLLTGALPAQEQDSSGRERRGSFRFGSARGSMGSFSGRSGLLFELGNESTQAEIQMTEEQKTQLDALTAESASSMEEFTRRLQAATSEQELEEIRNAMREQVEANRVSAEEKVRAMLTPEQYQRLEQIQLHRESLRAFTREDISAELGLSPEQIEQFEQLAEERRSAFRQELGFNASDEERKEFDAQWNAKALAVLSDAQRTQWLERVGPPPPGAARMFRMPRESASSSSPSVGPQMPQRPVYTEEALADAKPVVSFGGSPVESLDPEVWPETPASDLPSGKLTFNFQLAPWKEVLRLFAREADLTLDIIDLPPGTFEYYDTHEYTPTEALDIINGYLLPKGYMLIQRDQFLVSLNVDRLNQTIPPHLIPNVTPEQLDQRGRNELLTVVFPLEGVDVEQIASEVNEIKGPQGKVVAMKSSNSVLVTDLGSNLVRVRDLLYDVTKRGGPNDVTFRHYPLQYISVIDAEMILRGLLGLDSKVTNVSSSAESRRAAADPRSFSRGSRDPRDPRESRDPRDYQPPAPTTPKVTAQIAVDTRMNQLLISATIAQHQLIQDALRTIDIDGQESRFSASNNAPRLQVYTVSSSDAREVTKTIDALMPGVVVNEDVRNNKIHINATPEQHRQVQTLIAQMEGVGGSQQMAVLHLNSIDPLSAAATLRSMFLKDGDLAPTIEADVYGRRLLVRGDPGQITQIRGLLQDLGENGQRGSQAADTSRVRTIPLSGRDPSELLPLLERMWQTSQEGTSIRIVNPQDRAPVRGADRPDHDESRPNARGRDDFAPQSDQRPSVQRSPRFERGSVPVRFAAQTSEPEAAAESAPPDEGEPAQSPEDLTETLGPEWQRILQEFSARREGRAQEQGTAPGASSNSEITITIVGDELVVTGDPDKLNDLQTLLEQTMQTLPPRITWTVFYLKAADAQEAALMLSQLFPQSTVGTSGSASSEGMLGSLSSGFSSLGSGLMDMTGLGSLGQATQTLRIIAEPRLNALFVSGPVIQVREIEEMLSVLDGTDLPDSFRDKTSRMIPILHADAQRVHDMVKEAYKPYLEEQQQRTNDRNNPLAQMMGMGGRSNRQEQQRAPEAKLALAVDTSTSHLIVWADEALFNDVKSLVESIDQAAEKARHTIQVVQLRNTSSASVSSAVGSLMPKVSISTTGSRRTPDSSSSSSSSSSSRSPSSNSSRGSSSPDDRFQRFMEMRSRGFGGGSDRSGPSFGGFGSRSGGSGSPFGGRSSSSSRSRGR